MVTLSLLYLLTAWVVPEPEHVRHPGPPARSPEHRQGASAEAPYKSSRAVVGSGRRSRHDEVLATFVAVGMGLHTFVVFGMMTEKTLRGRNEYQQGLGWLIVPRRRDPSRRAWNPISR